MSGERDWKSAYLEELDAQEAREQAWQEEQARLRECIATLAGAAWGRTAQLDQLLKDLRNAAREGADSGQVLAAAKAATDFVVREMNEEAEQALAASDLGAAEASLSRDLLALLDAIDFPDTLAEQVASLRLRLRHPRSDDRPDARVRAFASLIGSLRSGLLTEKEAYEEFLRSVSEQIERLQASLANMLGAQGNATEAGRALQAGVSAQLSDMRDSVNAATDLEQLKSSVRGSLDQVEEMVGEFLRKDAERNRQMESELEQLSSQLQEMRNDSSRLQRQLAEERRRATTDALTGLSNRLALDNRLAQEVARWKRHGHPLSIVMIDVDLFKQINDNFGHQTGDRVLRELGRRLPEAARESDTIARYGGEEFVMVLTDTTLEQGMVVGEKVRALIEALRFHYEGRPVPVTISAGVAQAGKDESAEDLIGRADAALYAAKEGGRNRLVAAD